MVDSDSHSVASGAGELDLLALHINRGAAVNAWVAAGKERGGMELGHLLMRLGGERDVQ